MFAKYQEQRKNMQTPKSIKLIYFNATGRAEGIRAILTVGGVEYDNHRIDGEKDWPTMKPTMPFGVLPVLEVDGVVIPESTACARLAAKYAGLSGASVVEEATADAAVDTLIEIREKIIKAHFEKDEEKKKPLMEDLVKVSTEKLTALDKFIADHNDGKSGFFTGSEMTWADLYFLVVMEFLRKGIPDALTPHSNLTALWDTLQADKRVQDYINSRPDYKF